MKRPESSIQREVMLAASGAGVTIWRNNTGSAWQGRRMVLNNATVILSSGRSIHIERAVLLSDPRPVEFGLCRGSSDLIGLRPVIVEGSMIGTTIAQFVALEVKTSKALPTREQQTFLDHVLERGGAGGIVRSGDDVETLLRLRHDD